MFIHYFNNSHIFLVKIFELQRYALFWDAFDQVYIICILQSEAQEVILFIVSVFYLFLSSKTKERNCKQGNKEEISDSVPQNQYFLLCSHTGVFLVLMRHSLYKKQVMYRDCKNTTKQNKQTNTTPSLSRTKFQKVRIHFGSENLSVFIDICLINDVEIFFQ